MKKSSIIIIVIVAIIAILTMSIIGSYNGLTSKKEVISEKEATLDSKLQRRADLIPNLVNTVKGFTAHENDVIDKVTQARQNLVGAQSIEDKQKADAELTAALKSLTVVVENYPELKSSENYLNLQTELAGSENRISVARDDYNKAVKEYNSSIKKFPSNIIAGMFGFSDAKYFEASESAKEVPSVNF